MSDHPKLKEARAVLLMAALEPTSHVARTNGILEGAVKILDAADDHDARLTALEARLKAPQGEPVKPERCVSHVSSRSGFDGERCGMIATVGDRCEFHARHNPAAPRPIPPDVEPVAAPVVTPVKVEPVQYLDCPCCGDEGAYSKDGMFTDGQALICGCKGHVSCDSETDPYVSVDDCDCGVAAPVVEPPGRILCPKCPTCKNVCVVAHQTETTEAECVSLRERLAVAERERDRFKGELRAVREAADKVRGGPPEPSANLAVAILDLGRALELHEAHRCPPTATAEDLTDEQADAMLRAYMGGISAVNRFSEEARRLMRAAWAARPRVSSGGPIVLTNEEARRAGLFACNDPLHSGCSDTYHVRIGHVAARGVSKVLAERKP